MSSEKRRVYIGETAHMGELAAAIVALRHEMIESFEAECTSEETAAYMRDLLTTKYGFSVEKRGIYLTVKRHDT